MPQKPVSYTKPKYPVAYVRQIVNELVKTAVTIIETNYHVEEDHLLG